MFRAAALLLCLSTPLFAQDPAAEATLRSDLADAAYARLRSTYTRPPQGSSEEEALAWWTTAREAFLETAESFAGTGASFDCRLEAAMARIRGLKETKEGLAELVSVHGDLDAIPASARVGWSITPEKIAHTLGRENSRLEDWDAAEIWLNRASGAEGELGEAVALQLKRLPTLREKWRLRQQLAIGATPNLKATGIGGEAIDLAALRGKVVLLDFWATWCGPCIKELPHIRAAYEKYHEAGFEIIGLSLDRTVTAEEVAANPTDANGNPRKTFSADTLREFCEQNGLSWPQVYDGGYWRAAIPSSFGIRSIPYMVLLDQAGTVRFDRTQLRGEGALANRVAELLGLNPDPE